MYIPLIGILGIALVFPIGFASVAGAQDSSLEEYDLARYELEQWDGTNTSESLLALMQPLIEMIGVGMNGGLVESSLACSVGGFGFQWSFSHNPEEGILGYKANEGSYIMPAFYINVSNYRAERHRFSGFFRTMVVPGFAGDATKGRTFTRGAAVLLGFGGGYAPFDNSRFSKTGLFPVKQFKNETILGIRFFFSTQFLLGYRYFTMASETFNIVVDGKIAIPKSLMEIHAFLNFGYHITQFNSEIHDIEGNLFETAMYGPRFSVGLNIFAFKAVNISYEFTIIPGMNHAVSFNLRF